MLVTNMRYDDKATDGDAVATTHVGSHPHPLGLLTPFLDAPTPVIENTLDTYSVAWDGCASGNVSKCLQAPGCQSIVFQVFLLSFS